MSAASYAVWGVLLLTALSQWLYSLARPLVVGRPGDMISWLATHPIGRFCLLAAWMFLGWHLFAR
jgi:hypothetical protein